MGFALNDCDTITGSILMEMLTRFCIFSLVFTEAALLHNSVSSVPYTTKKEQKKVKGRASECVFSFHLAPTEFGNHGNREIFKERGR